MFLKNGAGLFLRMTSGRQTLAKTEEGRAQIVASLPVDQGPYEWVDDVTIHVPIAAIPSAPTETDE